MSFGEDWGLWLEKKHGRLWNPLRKFSFNVFGSEEPQKTLGGMAVGYWGHKGV